LQWLALVLLTAGVGLVQYHEAASAAAAAIAGGTITAGMSAVAVGVAAVLASSLLSGFANVYFEKASTPFRRHVATCPRLPATLPSMEHVRTSPTPPQRPHGEARTPAC
jgi:hypothetical protein